MLIWRTTAAALLLAASLPASSWADDPDLQSAISAICAVDREGTGHAAAVEAMKVLNAVSTAEIPTLLEAMDNANPLALNWLRGAIGGAIERGGQLPVNAIRDYFDDRSHSHLGRLLAYELLTSADADLAAELIPAMIDDPSLPLRRMAIDHYTNLAADQTDLPAIGSLGFALAHARETDQITKLRDELAKRNVQIDLTRQLGFLSKWQLVGPFDHSGEANFNTPLGPELNLQQIDLKAEYEGKPDENQPRTVRWVAYETSDPTGIVNLNDQVGKLKGVITYGVAQFNSDADQTVQIRCGCINAVKVWVNGELAISEEVYHNGMDPDQFSGTAKLKKGLNEIVVKVCQNEQPEPWAGEWMFQVRVCDATGKSVLPVAPAEPAQ